MSDGTLTASDAIALRDGDGMFGGGNAFFWVFALLLLGNGGFYGNNNGNYVTQAEMTNQLNAQTMQNQLQQIALSSANNNYETAQLINGQTNTLMQQNNTNLINAIQGFNNLSQQISNLSAHLDTCCCDIKTQMLQDKLDEANAKIVAQQNEISNAQQTQTILNTLGRFVAWAGSGSQTASVTTAG